MPSAQRLYRAGILLVWYGTVDTTHADRHLKPCLEIGKFIQLLLRSPYSINPIKVHLCPLAWQISVCLLPVPIFFNTSQESEATSLL